VNWWDFFQKVWSSLKLQPNSKFIFFPNFYLKIRFDFGADPKIKVIPLHLLHSLRIFHKFWRQGRAPFRILNLVTGDNRLNLKSCGAHLSSSPAPFTFPFHFSPPQWADQAGQPTAPSLGAAPLFSSPTRQGRAKAAARSSSKLHSPGCTPRAALLAIDPFIQVAFVDQHSSSAPFPAAVVKAMAFAAYHVFDGMPQRWGLSLFQSKSNSLMMCISSLPSIFVFVGHREDGIGCHNHIDNGHDLKMALLVPNELVVGLLLQCTELWHKKNHCDPF
jgi:hypothetical protein